MQICEISVAQFAIRLPLEIYNAIIYNVINNIYYGNVFVTLMLYKIIYCLSIPSLASGCCTKSNEWRYYINAVRTFFFLRALGESCGKVPFLCIVLKLNFAKYHWMFAVVLIWMA